MIILSIPYASRNTPEVAQTTHEVDLVEYRLDYEEHLKDIETGFFDSKTIVTIRDTSEGGINHYSREDQLVLYKDILKLTKALVDDEILHYTDISPELDPKRLILSWHAMDHENAYTNLPEIIKLSNRLPSMYLKIAINIDDYMQLEMLHDELSRSNKPILFAGLGKLGKLARLLFSHLGAYGTYVGITGQETAKGQLTFEECKTYHLYDMNSKHLIGGIIGEEQIWQSHGLFYYNKILYAHKYPAHYLPFLVTSWDDFWNWFTQASKYIYFFGFSITMPWKGRISQCISSENKIINTFLPGRYSRNEKPWDFNTDKEAFIRSLDFLKVPKSSPVLIFGTGSMAELALSIFVDYSNVCIWGRNEKRLKFLSDGYNVSVLSKNALNGTQWSLFINATSVGTRGDSLPMEFKHTSYQSVIDLPYTGNETKLVLKCRKDKIPVVSGYMFWKWQAEQQEDLFLEEIRSLLDLQISPCKEE